MLPSRRAYVSIFKAFSARLFLEVISCFVDLYRPLRACTDPRLSQDFTKQTKANCASLLAHTHDCLTKMPKAAALPWPTHWYLDHYGIRCVVPHCGFTTNTYNLREQWAQLHAHCTHTDGAEHALLKIMVQQSKCALCDEPAFYGQRSSAMRALYDHEINAHGSARMFNIDSFVVLARESRILFSSSAGHLAPEPDGVRLAYVRMVEKVQALPAAELGLLFQKSGFRAGECTPTNLGRLLTYDPSAPPHEDGPYWWPVRPDRFLMFCRPHGSDPADSTWRRVWRGLRERYADGRI